MGGARCRFDRGKQNLLAAAPGGVICFTPGTRIVTPDGARRIEDLRPGDSIQTKDNGAQQVSVDGPSPHDRRAALCHAASAPDPVSGGALGIDRPDEDLLVSPQHRMLVKGAAAQSLFHAPKCWLPPKIC